MDEIILMRKLKRKDEWALGKIVNGRIRVP